MHRKASIPAVKRARWVSSAKFGGAMSETRIRRQRTQEERKAESERKIIRAAIDLFARQGYMRTTINQVGKAAGYTGGLVSHRFGSKEALLKAVVQRMSSRYLHDQLRPTIDLDSAERSVEKHIETFFKELATREKSMRALYVIMGEALGAVPEVQKDIAELNKGIRGELEALIERGVKAGAFRKDLDVKSAAVLLLAVLRGVAIQVLTDKQAVDIDALLPLVQRQVLASLK